MTPKVLVLSGDGINCERETAAAFVQAGANVQIVRARELLQKPQLLLEHQVFALPGGFSYGDEIVSGQVLGLALKEALKDVWPSFMQRRGLTLGICNGFQILTKMGVFGPLTLVANRPAGFRDQWIGMTVEKSNCHWTKGLAGEELFLPIRHGEGRIWAPTEQRVRLMEDMKERRQIVLRYQGDPNGSLDRIAGLCDLSGQVFGLMPHPEAALRPGLFPEKTLSHKVSLHQKIFSNALAYTQENL